MKTYRVMVCRTETVCLGFTVRAENEEDATFMAHEEAVNFSFPRGEAEYEVHKPEEVK